MVNKFNLKKFIFLFFLDTLFNVFNKKEVLIPKAPVALLENAPWVFRTTKSHSNFLSVKDWLCQSAYMGANTLASMIWASKQSFMESLLPPEIKLKIQEGADRVIPAIVDRLVEGIKPSKKS